MKNTKEGSKGVPYNPDRLELFIYFCVKQYLTIDVDVLEGVVLILCNV